MIPTDEELLRVWDGGNREAGDTLFVRHFDAIVRFFDGRAAESEVEELTQRTFLGALEARARFRGDASFRTFLFAIARRQLLKSFERKRRHAPVTFRTMSMIDLAGPSPRSLVIRSEQRHSLMEAMRTLPVDHQLALELHYWEDLSTKEVGFVLDCPAGTVKRWLHEARKRLARTLGVDDKNLGLRAGATSA